MDSIIPILTPLKGRAHSLPEGSAERITIDYGAKKVSSNQRCSQHVKECFSCTFAHYRCNVHGIIDGYEGFQLSFWVNSYYFTKNMDFTKILMECIPLNQAFNFEFSQNRPQKWTFQEKYISKMSNKNIFRQVWVKLWPNYSRVFFCKKNTTRGGNGFAL